MRVAVLMPCLDEADALPAVIADLKHDPSLRLIVIDNGSTDQSVAIARALGCEVLVEPLRGYGGAVLRGMSHLAALSADDQPDIVVVLDADHSSFASDLPALTGPIVRDEADFVLGERLTRGDAAALTPPQRFGNLLATQLIYRSTRHRYQDMGPFRAIRWSSLQALQMEDRTWGWNVEMQLKAIKYGLRVLEVPVGNRPRIGQSKISGTVQGVVRAGAKILYACWRYG